MKIMTTILLLSIFLYSSAPVLNFENHEKFKQEYNQMQRQVENELYIERILSTLRQIESGNNYEAKGRSGEIGAYQFMPATWNYYCQILKGQKLSIYSKENQDAIARYKVIMLIEQGFTIEEIASFWNCGSINYAGRRGKNKKGIKYNVPKYVQKFKRIYEST